MTAKWGPLVTVLVVYLLLALLYSVVVPIFEAPDEPAHFLYANDLAAGKGLPILSYSGSPEEYHQPPLYYWLVAAILRRFDTSDYDQFTVSNPHAAISDASTPGNKNAFLHDPARENWPFKGLALAVHMGRLTSVGLGMVTICATYGLALKLFSPPSSPHVLREQDATNASRILKAAAAAAVVAFNPQFLFMSGALNNDNAVTALCSLALWATVIYFDRPRSVRWLVILGVLSGLASLTKTTGIAVVALVLGVLIAKAIQQRLIGTLWLDAGIIILLTAIIGGWWYTRNALLYADPFLSRYVSHRFDGEAPRTAVGILRRFEEGEISFWGTFGWLNITWPEWVYILIRAWTRLSGVGLLVLSIRWLMGKRIHVDLPTLVITLAWTGLVAATLTQWILVAGGLQGRLLFPAIAALGVMLIAGWTSLVPGRWQLWMAAIPAVGLATLAIVTPLVTIAPSYARPTILASSDLPTDIEPVDLTYAGRVKLIGYRVTPPVASPGNDVDVILYWQMLESVPGDFSVFIHLFGRDRQRIATMDTYPGLGNFPTSQWETGRVVRDVYPIRIAPDADAPTLVTINVGWYYFYGSREGYYALDPSGHPTTTVGVFKLAPDRWPEPKPDYELSANFDNIITLLGYSLQFEANAGQNSPDEVETFVDNSLRITLFWQPQAQPTDDFTAFVHLVDANGNIVAQMDQPPLNGDYPTSFWEPDEVIQDSMTIPLPPGENAKDKLPAGEYWLQVGLYRSEDLRRVPVLDAAGQAAADEVTLPNPVTLP